MLGKEKKETPIFSVTLHDIKKWNHVVYSFLMYMRRKHGKDISARYKAAVANPRWATEEILIMAMYGYTKKTKFSRKSTYLRWNRCPKTMENRILSMLGKPGRAFMEEYNKKRENSVNTVEDVMDIPTVQEQAGNLFQVDRAEVSSRMQAYIEDFDLHSSVDMDVLKNVVTTQVIIEMEHRKQLLGQPCMSPQDMKNLSLQLKDYISILGLSKKDRADLYAERQKGSIAELTLVYEKTQEKYVNMEREFLQEELELLLAKYNRRNDDGEREINAKEFQIFSGGFTVEEAEEYLEE